MISATMPIRKVYCNQLHLTINRKKFLYDILSPLKYHCKKDTVSRVFDVSKRQRLLFCLVLYLGHYMIPLCKISHIVNAKCRTSSSILLTRKLANCM